MPCDPIDPSDVTVPSLPSTFGGGIVPQLPSFDLDNPLDLEDLQDLMDKINMLLPGGSRLKPHLSSQYSKDVLDAVLSLLEKFMPFLTLYAFFLPILKMILCVIEILCAINNPFKMVRALIRLFRVCIPEFLALFPAFAIILMILSLLLLILALIIYLIERIIRIIEQIIRNLEILAQAVKSADSDSVIAITTKLGDLLCIFQNLFVLLGIILLIIEVITKLLQLTFRLPPCSSDDSSSDGCCTPDVCPSFIKNQKSFDRTTGSLQYLNRVSQISVTTGETIVREASFQFFDGYAPANLTFNNITHAFDLPEGVSQVFFPSGEVYTSKTTPNSVPYTIDVRFLYNPSTFGRTDPKDSRFVRVKSCIIFQAPIDGYLGAENQLLPPMTGTLSIGGGIAYEDDGVTICKASASDDGAASLDTLISLPNVFGTSDDLALNPGLFFPNLSYTFTTNHYILIAKSLITVGCHPDVALNKDIINNTIAGQFNSNTDALNNIQLPDIASTQDCIVNAVTTFRQSVSVESAQQLQDTVVSCLNTLRDQTNTAIKGVVNAGFDPYKSDFEVDPKIQFTTKPIQVEVTLNETGANNMVNNLPQAIGDELALGINPHVTFGQIGRFTYDGYSKFIADLTSKDAGNGEITISYNNQILSLLDNPTDIAQTPSVSVKKLTYTFVQSSALTTGGATGDNSGLGHDEGDIAQDAGDRD